MSKINSTGFVKRIKQVLGIFLYNAIAKHLPVSFSHIKVGQKTFRALCGKLILTKCGKKVNIERGAVFSSRVCLGDRSGIGIRASIGGGGVL